MASLSFPPLLTPVIPGASSLPVGPVAAVAPAALLAEMESLPMPLPGAQPAATAADGTPSDTMPDGAAMRPDQVAMARQSWPNQDGSTLASSWRGMVRNYGTQLVNRELQARPGQLPSAVLVAGQLSGQDPRVLRQAEQQNSPFDAWRFTVHAGSARDQHLRVVEQDQDAQQQQQRRRRARAALRLELVLLDGTVVTVQAEPLADGVRLELCAPDAAALARLRALQPELEKAVARAGMRVLGWTYRDSLPLGPANIRLPSADAAAALSLPVFRAMAEMALVLPAH